MNSMLTAQPLLTKADRCERDGAAAMVRVTTENLGVWLFCGNCWDKNKKSFPSVIRVHDERFPL